MDVNIFIVIYIYVYIHAHTHIYFENLSSINVDVGQRTYLLIHPLSFPQFGCWSPLYPCWLNPKIALFHTRRANSQVWSAEVWRTSCCHCWWCMNLSSSTTHCAATWRQGRICGNGFAASWSCFLWLSPGCRPYRLYMISHDFSWCLGTILGGWW